MFRSGGTPESELKLLADDVVALERRIAELAEPVGETSVSPVLHSQPNQVGVAVVREAQELHTVARALSDHQARSPTDATEDRILEERSANEAADDGDRISETEEAKADGARWWMLGGGMVGAAAAGVATAAPEFAAATFAAAGPTVAAVTASVGPQLAAVGTAVAGAGAAPLVAGGVAVAAVGTGVAMLAGAGGQQAAPAHWVPDADRIQCAGCQVEFGSITWKHHCRSCGEIFCNNCAPVRQTGERACDTCASSGNGAS